MKVVIIIIETLRIVFTYEADAPKQSSFGAEWGSPQVTVHLEVPEGLDPMVVMAVRADDGTIQLVEDPAKVTQKTAAAWTALRTERNARLAACDWTQLQDAHLSAEKKSAWADYRQALRDLPDTVTITSPADLVSVEWPTSPVTETNITKE